MCVVDIWQCTLSISDSMLEIFNSVCCRYSNVYIVDVWLCVVDI